MFTHIFKKATNGWLLEEVRLPVSKFSYARWRTE
jgi:hypothetical protein